MFKTKEEQYNRIFQLFERVENPYQSLLLEGDGGPSGFEYKWFDGPTGILYEDKTKQVVIKNFKKIVNATEEIEDLSIISNRDRGYNYWIVESNNKTYLLYVSPTGFEEKYDENEKNTNQKEGSGVVMDVYYIFIKK